MKSARKCSTLLKWLFGFPVPQFNLLQVNVAVKFNNIAEVDEQKNLITLDLSLWLDWVDKRVKSLPKNDKEYVTVIGIEWITFGFQIFMKFAGKIFNFNYMVIWIPSSTVQPFIGERCSEL